MKNIFKELKKYPLLVYFAVFLYTLSIADWFSPHYERSELENRPLATWPKLNISALINNEYTPKIEDFTEDHFIRRNDWISLKSICESFLGKTENNGVVYGKDGYMFTKHLSANYTQTEKNVDIINKFSERHPDRKISFLLAPTAPGVITEVVTPGSPVIDNDYIIDLAVKNSKVNVVDVRETLKSHTDKYIYYRTDHHWTTLGAYYAYRQYMETVGREAKALGSFKFNDVFDFLGTHYSKAKSYNVNPDILSYIDNDATIEINGEINSIYEKEKLEVRDKYAMFLRGNPGMATIHGKGTGKIMIIKDSYANCFVPFMTDSYEQIDIYDMRYINTGLDKLIEKADYDEILFLYNAETFMTDKDLVKVNMFN